VRGKEKEHLMGLALDHNRPGWHQQHGALPPKQLRTLINHEDKAVAISQFQFNLMPGLLQTAKYTEALLTEAGRIPEEEISERVRTKFGRRTLLTRRSAPDFTFYIHEFALRLPVGGPEVMSDQLHELLRTSVLPNVSIRIVPTALGTHAAISGSFILMEFKSIKPVVYLDSETSSLFLELPVQIHSYRDILAALDETALPEGQSRDFIGDLAVRLYGEQDDLAQEQLQ
jgi:Domain of unknown function (DUF5753)